MEDGGCPRQTKDRKPKIEESTYSSVKYPKIQDNIVTICLVLSEKWKLSMEGYSLWFKFMEEGRFGIVRTSWEIPASDTVQ